MIIVLSVIIVVGLSCSNSMAIVNERVVLRVNSVEIHRKHEHLGQCLIHLSITKRLSLVRECKT